jgi:hypothetical protein
VKRGIAITVKDLIAVLEGMDPDRTVISTVTPGKKIRGVGTMIVNDKPVTVIR